MGAYSKGMSMTKDLGTRRAFKQKFSAVGWWGAALFVLCPSITAAMLAISVPNYLEALGSRYSYRPESELFHPAFYLILQAFSLAGVAMMIVGREIEQK